MLKDKQGESTSNHARHQKKQIDVTINLLPRNKGTLTYS